MTNVSLVIVYTQYIACLLDCQAFLVAICHTSQKRPVRSNPNLIESPAYAILLMAFLERIKPKKKQSKKEITHVLRQLWSEELT
jgi:hypothetical protein